MSDITIQNDSKMFFMGTLYTIRLKSSLSLPAIHLKADVMEISLCDNVKAAPRPFLKRWYLTHAEQYLTKQTAFWCAQMNVRINRITIKDQKTRWGSCSSLGNINYNWRIIMAPPAVIDYLIIHELSHRRQMNHSADFWQQVTAYCPEHKKCRLWLKEHAGTLLRCI